MARTVILPYKMGSQGAKHLAGTLGLQRVRQDGRYRHRCSNTIINWGCHVLPTNTQDVSDRYGRRPSVLNHPNAIRKAADKLLAYRAMDGLVSIPMFTTRRAAAQEWVDNGETVVCRSVLNGHGGVGITLVGGDHGGRITRDYPLYTVYVKKRNEYRVHVLRGEIIDYAHKRLRQGSEGNNHQIRNFDNGWIFTRGGAVLPDCVKAESIAAVEALGLDFGAVDVGMNEHTNTATVYEVNTAPGMEGTTLDRYAAAFKNLLNL